MVEFIPNSTKEEINLKFVGREEYIAEFNNRKKCIKHKKRNIYNLYGEGGIGKSSLLKEFIDNETKEKYDLIRLDFNNINTISDFYERIFEQIGKQSISAIYFMLAYLTYYKKKNPQVQTKESSNIFVDESGFIADLVDWSDLLWKGADATVPVVGSAVKLTIKSFKKIKDKFTLNSNAIKFLQGLDDVDDIEKELDAFLKYDIELLSEKDVYNGIIFIFDTYEETNISDELKGVIAKFIKNFDKSKSLFVIAGREKFEKNRAMEETQSWGDGLYIDRVVKLKDDEIIKILNSSRVLEKDIIDAILKSSKGVPFYLELAIDTYHKQDIKDIQTFENLTHPDIYDNYMKYNKKSISIFESISIPRYIDFNLYNFLTNEGEIEFINFVSSSLFTEIDGKFYILELFRQHIVVKLSASRKQSLNSQMFDYYNDFIQNRDTSKMISKDYFFEAFYHHSKYIDLEDFGNWFDNIKNILISKEQYGLLFELYKETRVSLEIDDAHKLFIFWIENNEKIITQEGMHIGSYLIKNYYIYFDDMFREKIGSRNFNIDDNLFSWLDKFGGWKYADYLMITYLKSSHTKGQAIKRYVKGWTERQINYNNISASHLLADYLKKEDTKIEDVTQLVEQYLSKEEYQKNFSYIVQPYLNKGGLLRPIEQSTQNWINNNIDEDETYSRMVKIYFGGGGLLKPIEQSVQNWLNKYKEENRLYGYILQSYLDRRGCLEPIYKSVKTWLGYNYKNMRFTYILEYFIEKNDSKLETLNFLNETLIKWLIYAVEEDSIMLYTINTVLKEKLNDFDDIDSIDEKSLLILEQFILDYNLKNTNNNIDKYFLVCSKYLKKSVWTDMLLNKVLNDIEVRIDHKYSLIYTKLVNRINDKNGILDSLTPIEVINKYPLLREKYITQYFYDKNNILKIKDIYIDYLNDILNSNISKGQLQKKSMFVQYFNNGQRDTDIDSLLIKIFEKYIENKNPIKMFIYSYIKTKNNFFEIKPFIIKYIEYGGESFTDGLLNILNSYLEQNPKEEHHQLFLDFLIEEEAYI